MTEKTHTTVYESDMENGDSPPKDLNDFIAWIQGILDKVPVEFRGNATIDIRAEYGSYESNYGCVEISYWRPETQADIDARAKYNAEYKASRIAERERQERETLAELKAKYERPS